MERFIEGVALVLAIGLSLLALAAAAIGVIWLARVAL